MKKEFTAVIKQDSGWWIGWIEEVQGVNSQGKTKTELMKNLRSALAEALEFNWFAWTTVVPRHLLNYGSQFNFFITR